MKDTQYAILAVAVWLSVGLITIVLISVANSRPVDAPCQDRAVYIGAWHVSHDCPEGTTLHVEGNLVTCRCPAPEAP